MPVLPDEGANEPRPGETVLHEPFERLVRHINRISTQIVERHGPIPEDLAQLDSAKELITQLISFAVRPGPMLTREQLEGGARFLREIVSPEEAMRAFFAAGEHRRGRPSVRRFVAAAALEAKRNNPRLSRLALARRFCPCSKRVHDSNCAMRLRRDIQRLNKLIRKILTEYPS
jgi:hypothetical protein